MAGICEESDCDIDGGDNDLTKVRHLPLNAGDIAGYTSPYATKYVWSRTFFFFLVCGSLEIIQKMIPRALSSFSGHNVDIGMHIN